MWRKDNRGGKEWKLGDLLEDQWSEAGERRGRRIYASSQGGAATRLEVTDEGMGGRQCPAPRDAGNRNSYFKCQLEIMVSEGPFNLKLCNCLRNCVWQLYSLHSIFLLIQKHLCEHGH